MEQQPELSADVPRAWDRPVVTVPTLTFLSLIGGQFPSFSTQANVYAIGTGGALVWLGLANRVPRRPVPHRLRSGAGWWLVPVLVFGVFEASTFMLGSRDDFPTFSKIADPLLDDPLVRSVAYFGWLSAFWGLVRR
ncbi:hypothetical protein [Plantactinospora endophytica]|uniref:Uncharacterized protein n=1 Tax=Plantactinospora endophytica TaxID=673535 RepID=A0ABQ4DVY5_9ACTN|nr:hypothetical protein [Plantactinospora endophytica]GIG86618.1 hypothetical protein Pen02_15540 [Plantactinospora endophytica]